MVDNDLNEKDKRWIQAQEDYSKQIALFKKEAIYMIPEPKIKLDLTIRLGTVDDTNFIIKTWCKTQQQIYPNNYAFDFFQKYNTYIKNLIDKSVILVSCLSDSPEDIIGFIVYTSFDQKCVVHFAYVRPDERRDGIFNNLLTTANPMKTPVIFTSPAKNENVMEHLVSKYIYDPTLVTML